MEQQMPFNCCPASDRSSWKSWASGFWLWFHARHCSSLLGRCEVTRLSFWSHVPCRVAVLVVLNRKTTSDVSFISNVLSIPLFPEFFPQHSFVTPCVESVSSGFHNSSILFTGVWCCTALLQEWLGACGSAGTRRRLGLLELWHRARRRARARPRWTQGLWLLPCSGAAACVALALPKICVSSSGSSASWMGLHSQQAETNYRLTPFIMFILTFCPEMGTVLREGKLLSPGREWV